MKRRPPVKMVFGSVKQRDDQLKAFSEGSYRIDKNNELIVWVEC